MSGAEPARGPGPGQACGDFLVHIRALILCQVGGNKCRRKLRVPYAPLIASSSRMISC